ncbi:MAG: hypothetical protein VKO65_03425 [Cyanobacteriota bacterium]|nr:hypothetical protein [Cyanobacteriota bacterium]
MAAGLALSGVLWVAGEAGGSLAAEPPSPEPPSPEGGRSLLSSELQLDPAERSRFQRVAENADALAATPPAGAASTPATSPWAGTLELYGFLPLDVTNRTTIQGFTAETNLNLGQLLDALTSTFSLRGSVEHGRLGLLTDISYVSLQNQVAIERRRDRFRFGDGRLRAGLNAYREFTTEEGRANRRARLRDRLTARRELITEEDRANRRERLRARAAERLANLGEVEWERGQLASRLAARERRSGTVTRSFRTDLDTEQGIYDVALRYRIGARESAVADPGTVTVIPYAGIRILDVGLGIDSLLSSSSRGRQLAIARSFGSPVVQPLLGTQAQVFVAPRLRLFARGDAAGFGISGDDSYSANAQVGLGYAVGNSTQIDLSWRYRHMAANNGEQRPNAYVLSENGIELGLKFFF